MTLGETIAHVLKLDQEATSSPWLAGHYEPGSAYSSCIQNSFGSQLLHTTHHGNMRQDAALIASYRSLCPKMARALRTAVAALRDIDAKGCDAKYCTNCSSCIASEYLEEIQKEFES